MAANSIMTITIYLPDGKVEVYTQGKDGCEQIVAGGSKSILIHFSEGNKKTSLIFESIQYRLSIETIEPDQEPAPINEQQTNVAV